jgi:hypothetical protein
MGIDRADAAEQVRLMVWAAASEPAEIAEILCEEYYDPDDVREEDAGWIAQEVERAAATKREAEKSCPWSPIGTGSTPHLPLSTAPESSHCTRPE